MEQNQNMKLEVNLKNFRYNYLKIKEYIGNSCDIMPILKDNAYMTYINKRIDLLNELNVNIVGVAMVDEGVELRELGYLGDIFILNQPFCNEIDKIAKYNLTTGISSIEYLSKLGNFPASFNIHMEICTGMGRTGIFPSKVLEYINEAKKYSNINITGIYTHFSCSDQDKDYTNKQIESFNNVIDTVSTLLPKLKYIHACNSAGILNFPKAHYNLVRPGLILYGEYPATNLKDKINLKPVTRLKSKISFLKEVPAGTSISYGRTFTTKRVSKIATVPLGYANGLRRALSNRGYVVINNKIAPIVGLICMDSFMVDVTDIDVNINDDVFIWDNEQITINKIAKLCDTISYEILTGISNRVSREFINE